MNGRRGIEDFPDGAADFRDAIDERLNRAREKVRTRKGKGAVKRRCLTPFETFSICMLFFLNQDKSVNEIAELTGFPARSIRRILKQVKQQMADDSQKILIFKNNANGRRKKRIF